VSVLKNLSSNICRLRTAQGFTQQSFAEHIGMEYKYFQKIESGRRRNIELKTIEKIAKGLKIEPWQLIRPPL
jgi:transcriptional regulator with XRE-family HTH domain